MNAIRKKTEIKKMSKKKKIRLGQWIDDINDAVGRFVHIETFDGALREGRLTGLRNRDMNINGVEKPFPTAIELNDDSSDYIELILIRKITID